MTASELLKYQIDTCGKQILIAMNGLEDTALDYRVNAGSKSVREFIEHLSETYQAVITGSEGGNHEWGSFRLKGSTYEELLSEMSSLRESAVAKVGGDSDETLKMGADYIVGHDTYHLGQLASLRISLDSEWDSYSLYA